MSFISFNYFCRRSILNLIGLFLRCHIYFPHLMIFLFFWFNDIQFFLWLLFRRLDLPLPDNVLESISGTFKYALSLTFIPYAALRVLGLSHFRTSLEPVLPFLECLLYQTLIVLALTHGRLLVCLLLQLLLLAILNHAWNELKNGWIVEWYGLLELAVNIELLTEILLEFFFVLLLEIGELLRVVLLILL